MRIGRRIVSSIAAVWLTAGPLGAAQAEPLRISYFIWVGNGPFFVAKEKGLFAKEGVEVELINIEDHAAAFGSLVQSARSMLSKVPCRMRRLSRSRMKNRLVCVLALDEFRGGDGVLATKDIQTVADLKGKSVAVLPGSISHFYLNVLLKEAGLSEADIEVVDLSAEDAGQAFLLQEVDAAVTKIPF